ncbi:hypothetical protein DLE01_10510, partial [Streptomyces sp. FT05W]
MWVRRLDKRNHSFQVYGEKDTPDRRAATRGTACRGARTGARHGNGGAAPAGVSRRSDRDSWAAAYARVPAPARGFPTGPFTGEKLADLPESTPEDVEAAFGRARAAQPA